MITAKTILESTDEKLVKKTITELLVGVENNKKKYEEISAQFNPVYNEALRSIPIVKEFIKSRGLIIYGGTAIDFALRLHGDAIYPDEALAVPDLDFYSSRGCEDAYDLGEILYEEHFEDVRVVKAMFYATLRVDIKNKHFIADVSYLPADKLQIIPTLEYEGMKIVHPFYQYVDMHSAMSFPYDNAPLEVVFDRLNKDIKRFNILYKYFPVTVDTKKTIKMNYIEVNAEFAQKFVFTKFASYSLIFMMFNQLCGYAEKQGYFIDKKKPNAKYILKCDNVGGVSNDAASSNSIKLLSFNSLDIIHYDAVQLVKNSPVMNSADIVEYDAILHLIQPHIECKISTDLLKNGTSKNGSAKSAEKKSPEKQTTKSPASAESADTTNINIINYEDKLITICKTKVKCGDKEIEVTFTPAQLFLKECIANSIVYKEHEHIYLGFYKSMLAMIEYAEDIINYLGTKNNKIVPELLNYLPFFPVVSIYGKYNLSHAHKIANRQNETNIGFRIAHYKLPKNWTPKDSDKMRPEPFDYNTNSWFHQSGVAHKFADYSSAQT